MNGAVVYLGNDFYIQDEPTVTRIFRNNCGTGRAKGAGGRTTILELPPAAAQRLFEELGTTRFRNAQEGAPHGQAR